MGSRADRGHRNEHPQHEVKLSPFYIDCCAVSNVEYERFDPNHRRKRSDNNRGDCDPVVYVTPQDALNYCRWRAEQEGAPPDAYSLPSEAQWEYCSRAGAINKEYPWGDQFELHRCYTLDSSAGIACAVDAGTPSPYGLYQLPGNVREWCVDYYAEDAYARQNAQPTDPTGPRPLLLVNMQVVRGASYRDRGDAMARCAARDCAHPHSSSDDIGFRCVRSAARLS
jgi:formylglycine-generating enzyme required for sulfatase activity